MKEGFQRREHTARAKLARWQEEERCYSDTQCGRRQKVGIYIGMNRPVSLYSANLPSSCCQYDGFPIPGSLVDGSPLVTEVREGEAACHLSLILVMHFGRIGLDGWPGFAFARLTRPTRMISITIMTQVLFFFVIRLWNRRVTTISLFCVCAPSQYEGSCRVIWVASAPAEESAPEDIRGCRSYRLDRTCQTVVTCSIEKATKEEGKR